MQKKILTALLASLIWVVPVLADAQTGIIGSNTVAGLGTDIRIKGVDDGDALLVVLPPYGAEMLYDVVIQNEQASVHIPGTDLEQAGVYELSLERGSEIVIDGDKFTVLPESISIENSVLQSDKTYLRYDLQETATVSVILRDRFGNPLEGRPVRLIPGRDSDTVQSLDEETNAAGEQRFSIVAGAPGTVTLRAMDLLSGDTIGEAITIEVGSLTASAGGYAQAPAYTTQTVAQMQRVPSYQQPYYGNQFIGTLAGQPLYGQVAGFGDVSTFVIQAPTTMRANVDENLTITAVDSQGRTVEDYVGTILLSSTDPNAILPGFGEVTFRGADLGRKTLVLGLRFATPGTQTLYVEDSNNPGVSGTATIMVTGSNQPSTNSRMSITAPSNGETVGGDTVLVEGVAPPFINLVVSGGTEDVIGESDRTGFFSIPVTVSEDTTTLTVRDQSGQSGSASVTVQVDLSAPVIDDVDVDPLQPEVESDFTVTVALAEAETDAEVRLLIEELDRTVTLERVTGENKQYQTTLSIEEDGIYDLTIEAEDAAGNIATEVMTTEVLPEGLPTVQNVTAEPKPNAVMLQWDDLTDTEVDGYRIYIGDSPENFLYTLETEPNVTAATVAGLDASQTYYFAVTAFDGDRESTEKSDVVSAEVIGLAATVEEGNGSLQLKWNNLNAQTPLAQYILEYGVSVDAYTEKRLLQGSATTHTLRDLLNDVTYYLRLTPVTVSGETLSDLSVVVSGTPSSTAPGFQTGPADPIPGNLTLTPTDPVIVSHSGAPSQPTTGIPSSGWWLLLTGVLTCGYLVFRQRQHARTNAAFLQHMESQYRNGIDS